MPAKAKAKTDVESKDYGAPSAAVGDRVFVWDGMESAGVVTGVRPADSEDEFPNTHVNVRVFPDRPGPGVWYSSVPLFDTMPDDEYRDDRGYPVVAYVTNQEDDSA